jgi:hypothetical protein
MIEAVTKVRYEKNVKHTRYTPYWVDSNNPAGRFKRAPAGSGGPASSNEPPPQPPLYETASRAAAASHLMDRGGRGRGRGRRTNAFMRLARGIAGVFAMCRSHAADAAVHRRETRELHDDMRQFAASMGHPMPERPPPVPLPAYPEDLNEWHQ